MPKNKSKNYEQTALLVVELIATTKGGTLIWEDVGALGFFRAERADIRYILDNPRDGKPELIVGDVRVWCGYELCELRDAIITQQHGLRPKSKSPASTSPDPDVSVALRQALESFGK